MSNNLILQILTITLLISNQELNGLAEVLQFLLFKIKKKDFIQLLCVIQNIIS